MSATLSNHFRHFIVYISGALVVRGSHFLFLPLWFSLITPSEYGLLSLLTSFQLLVRVVITAGQVSVLQTTLFHGKTIYQERQVLGGVIATQLAIMIPLLIALALFYPYLNHYLFQSYASKSIIIATLLSCFFDVYNTLAHTFLTLQQRASTATTLHVISQIGMFILTYLFVAHLKKGVGGIIYAQLCAHFFASFTKSLHIIWTHYTPCFPSPRMLLPTIQKNLSLGIPFSMRTISITLTNNIDRWILASYTSLHVTGIYSLAAQVGVLAHECILSPFLQVYTPYLYRQYQQTPSRIIALEKKRRFHCSAFIAVCLVGVSIGYVIGAPIVVSFLPTRFAAALPLSYFMVVEKIFFAASHFCLLFAFYRKKIMVPAAIIISSNLMNCILDLSVVTSYGVWGCMYATVFSSLCAFIASLIYVRKIVRNTVIPATSTNQLSIPPPTSVEQPIKQRV